MVMLDYRRVSFICSPDFWGKWSNLTNMFQMSWFNHHLKAEADALWKQYLGRGEAAVAVDIFRGVKGGTFCNVRPGELREPTC